MLRATVGVSWCWWNGGRGAGGRRGESLTSCAAHHSAAPRANGTMRRQQLLGWLDRQRAGLEDDGARIEQIGNELGSPILDVVVAR